MSTPADRIFWADSFRQELESTVVDEGLLVWSLSGPSFVVRTPHAVIYLDPYLGGADTSQVGGLYRTSSVPLDPRQVTLVDAVLMSHNHEDHCHRATLTAFAAQTEAVFYGPISTGARMKGFGIPGERMGIIAPGDHFTVDDANVTVWPGNDPGEAQAVCYLIEADGVRLFFAGDSLATPTLDQVGAAGGVEIGMMAMGYQWYMSEAELLDAACRLKPRVLVAYHWDIWRGHTGDPVELGRLAERQAPPFDVKVLLPGQFLHYCPEGRYTIGPRG